MSIRCHSMLRTLPWLCCAWLAICTAGRGGRLLASDLLSMIPADVAGVLALHDLDASCDELCKFLGSHRAGFSGLNVGLVEEALDCEPGTWDTSKPVVFILIKPDFGFLRTTDFSETSTLLAFTPRDYAHYAELVGNQDGRIRRIEQAGSKYYVMTRDGRVFISGKRRSMRAVQRVNQSASLAASLDDEQRAMFAQNDIFLHLPMAQWRDKMNVVALLAINVMKFQAAAKQEPALIEASTQTFDWVGTGLRTVLAEMDSMSLGIAYDGDAFHITHYHAFRPDGSVADYLGRVKRNGVGPWDVLPKQPFFVFGTSDWQNDGKNSLASRLSKFLLERAEESGRIAPRLRRKVSDRTEALHDQMRGSYFMMCSAPHRLLPLSAMGGYVVEDAEEAGEQLRFIQKNAAGALADFMSGPYWGKMARIEKNGRTYYETPFNLDQMNDVTRQQMIWFYGEDARLQQAVLGKHHAVHVLAAPRTSSVFDFVPPGSDAATIGDDPLVQRMRKGLPPDPHLLIIVDVGRCLAAAPYLMQVSPQMTDGAPGASKSEGPAGSLEPPPSPGPMLGWACVLTPTAIKGHLTIEGDDAVRASELIKQLVPKLQGVVH
ncbi:MAG: hypothetical protein ABII12_07420 [Planctomycetota bacterium]